MLVGLLDTPLYKLDAWLRDESSFSRWEHVRVVDLATGQPQDISAPLPTDFRIEASLRRPEAAARLWLRGPTPNAQEALELDRDRRNARWLVQRSGSLDALPRWFFPEQPAPFAAELLHLVGRTTAAAFALGAFAVLVARGIATGRIAAALDRLRAARRLPVPLEHIACGPVLRDSILAVWLLAAALLTTRLYHQLPHIVDAVSYTFQAGIFASGNLTLPEPPLVNAFKGPFAVLNRGRLFSQYPPGAPALYAIGQVVGLGWLVGPLCCTLLIAATAAAASALYGRGTAFVALALGALSPFVLFQSGSFLSHPVAAGIVSAALLAFITAERTNRHRWYLASGALLGIGFLTREAASILFAVPLGAQLITTRNRRAIATMCLAGAPCVLVYLLYNQQLTGSPLTLPRQLFDPSDRFGFGDGVGFHTRHTLAAGLANADELLTSLQFELFGWPPLFALGVLIVPFLFGRATRWDGLCALGVLSFVVAYIGYFYHGVALGPRYYFEALPYVLLLAARGIVVLADLSRSRVAPAILVAALTTYALGFYLPLEVQRRADLSGQPNARKTNLTFVQTTPFGPKLNLPRTPALVTTADWWLYNTALAALNCPRLPDCDVLFALATNPADETRLRLQFSGRATFHAVDSAGQVDLVVAS